MGRKEVWFMQERGHQKGQAFSQPNPICCSFTTNSQRMGGIFRARLLLFGLLQNQLASSAKDKHGTQTQVVHASLVLSEGASNSGVSRLPGVRCASQTRGTWNHRFAASFQASDDISSRTQLQLQWKAGSLT